MYIIFHDLTKKVLTHYGDNDVRCVLLFETEEKANSYIVARGFDKNHVATEIEESKVPDLLDELHLDGVKAFVTNPDPDRILRHTSYHEGSLKFAAAELRARLSQ